MIKCVLNISDEEPCIKCCVYCEEQGCDKRCPISKTCISEEDVLKVNCPSACDENTLRRS